jgi:cyclohexanone monooxygenase
MRLHGWSAVDVKPQVLRAYNDRLQAKVEGTVWQVGGCKSWYQNDAGRNTALWPDFTFNFRKEVAQFDPSDYVIETAAQSAATGSRNQARPSFDAAPQAAPPA